ncbi:MAG: molecular chaperone SurA [Proteobacteria bacterium]|nr:molecular chaperone SurA [Pseudomonadota bacterium]
MRTFLSLLFFLLIASNAGFAQAQTRRADPIEADRIIAVVGEEVITQHELRVYINRAVRQLQKQGTQLPPREVLERQLLERMIMDRIQLQSAKESGIRIDDIQLDQALARIAAGNKMTVQQFRQALEKDGVEFAKFRDDIRDEISISRLREREVDSRLVISESEVDNYLAANQNQSNVEEYHLAHILMRAPEGASPEQLQKLKLRAEQALARARQGGNFAELTAAFSDAPDALQGGDLGFRPLDRMPTLYAEAAEKLQPGGVSSLLRSSAGFHIVKLLEKRGKELPPVRQTKVRHILIRVNEAISESEARRRLETVRERIVNGQDFAELARLYSQDGSATKGGDLGWVNAGDTVPEFERAMDNLKEKELSPVVQSPFGMHIMQVMERRQRDMSDETRRLMAKQALRERKLDEAYQDWLRQLRDQYYVEMRLEEK